MIQNTETSTRRYNKLIEILGTDYVEDKVENPYDFIHIATRGLSAGIISNFRTYFKLTRELTAHMLNISEPTLYRWIKSNRILERNYSVKLFEITDLFVYGSEVFGSQDNFFKWLNLPNTALGGMEPQELINISGGVSKISDEIRRIEHGVFG